nr:penicillin binding protein PBP4B [Bacillus licheniformis]
MISAAASLLSLTCFFPLPSTAQTAIGNETKQRLTYPVLTKAKTPEEAGFSSKKLKAVDRLIEQDVKAGFPGGALILIKDGKIIKKEVYGYKQKYNGLIALKHPKKMKANTMFDLASNTKMYAVNFALRHLVSTGKLDLNKNISQYLPDFKDHPEDDVKGKNRLRVIDLLHHNAGFPASWNYYDPKSAGHLYSQSRSKTLEYLVKTPLAYEPGTKQIYSDIDYMLLGLIIEKITNERLDTFVENRFYRPLGLRHTLFNPLQKGFKRSHFAPTERLGNTRDGTISFPNIRTYTLQGEVHDEKAFYSMEGVSGHAGLFSTVDDANSAPSSHAERRRLRKTASIQQFCHFTIYRAVKNKSHIWTRMAAQRQYRYGVDVRQARQQRKHMAIPAGRERLLSLIPCIKSALCC